MILFLAVALAYTELPSGECDDKIECKLYYRALSLAKHPTKERIWKSLTPIRHTTTSLKFDQQGRVLLAIPGLQSHYPYKLGTSFNLLFDTFLTAYPDLQIACNSSQSSDKTMRVRQLLGLPPNYRLDSMIEVYIYLKNIFRPCADPNISDKECVLNIPIFNNNSMNPDNPWYCKSPNEEIIQIGSQWENVSNKHFDWMCETWNNSFNKTKIYDNYPWTGLGYTFDWGSNSGFGISQFVALAGTSVVLNRKIKIEDYCFDNKSS